MGRTAPNVYISYWVNHLTTGNRTVSEVINNFVFSSEFLGLNVTQVDFITTMYRVVFDRDPAPWEEDAVAFWVATANNHGRAYVIEGFANSPEFHALSTSLGIAIDPVAAFIRRVYTSFLGRGAERHEVVAWVNFLTNNMPLSDVIRGFVFSPEYLSLNVSDEEFVRTMYRVALGRNAAPGEDAYVAAWANIAATYGRDAVITGFTNTTEFMALVAGLGLN
jgi:hypothetical protein